MASNMMQTMAQYTSMQLVTPSESPDHLISWI